MLAEDLHQLPLMATPAEAAAFNHALDGYVRYRADTPLRIQTLIAAAPAMPMAHALKGAMVMLSFKQANVPAAREAVAAAQQLASGATRREQAHIAALARWVAGDIEGTLVTWEDILAEAPRDLLAFRLHHFLSFWMGDPERMAGVAANVSPAWARDLPGYGTLLACRCFANEELGHIAAAEADGRAALEIDQGDLWAAHAVAHVLEMQGRQEEGIQLLDALEPHWAGANNLMHHLWWHRGLYHYERGEFAEVLDLYDRRFRNLASPLAIQQPDLYIDIQNAASMLYRLQRLGIDVGDRWTELADKAELRIGDHQSAFTLPHWMMALVAAGRWEAAGRMIEALKRDAATGSGTIPRLVRDAALPVCQAILAQAQGHPRAALDHMRPALPHMARLGGSHAQQDVLVQFYLDCARAAKADADIAWALAHTAKTYGTEPGARVGYRHAHH
jgi:tetratricopeptide (TPR) repeat protein